MLSETRPAKVGKWTEPALRVLRERYLMRQGGEVVETPEEMCWRVALTIASGEARYGRSEAAVREIATAFYDIMIEGNFLPKSKRSCESCTWASKVSPSCRDCVV